MLVVMHSISHWNYVTAATAIEANFGNNYRKLAQVDDFDSKIEGRGSPHVRDECPIGDNLKSDLVSTQLMPSVVEA